MKESRRRSDSIQLSSRKQGGVWFALALDENRKMITCSFSEESQRKAETAILRMAAFYGAPVQRMRSLNTARLRELYELYMGSGKSSVSSLDLLHVSSFRRKVYLLLCHIPRGRVTTYGAIAKKLGSRRYARAVGTAVASNPMPLVIPCHRIVLSTLKVGYYGLPGLKPSEGSPAKKQLLEREGVKFRRGRVSKESLWSPE